MTRRIRITHASTLAALALTAILAFGALFATACNTKAPGLPTSGAATMEPPTAPGVTMPPKLPGEVDGMVATGEFDESCDVVSGDPLAGVTVNLLASDGTVITAVTGPNGRFEFSDLAIDFYQVALVPPEGMVVTCNRDGTTDSTVMVELTSDVPSAPDCDFGLKAAPTP